MAEIIREAPRDTVVVDRGSEPRSNTTAIVAIVAVIVLILLLYGGIRIARNGNGGANINVNPPTTTNTAPRSTTTPQ